VQADRAQHDAREGSVSATDDQEIRVGGSSDEDPGGVTFAHDLAHYELAVGRSRRPLRASSEFLRLGSQPGGQVGSRPHAFGEDQAEPTSPGDVA
jgi:hypothetical protein